MGKMTGIIGNIKNIVKLKKELQLLNEKLDVLMKQDNKGGDTLNSGILNIMIRELLREKYLEKIPAGRLEHHEYSVYSQNGEDGIISEIFCRIGGCKSRTFVEFGVGNGTENNTVWLLCEGWSGLWIEAMQEHCSTIRKLFYDYIEKKRLFLKNEFVRPDNINSLIADNFTGEIDLLSIDIDGYDYDVWNAIDCIAPRVVIAEYNAAFPPPARWHMPYSESYFWRRDNYYGMTLSEARFLGEKKGYVLVGTDLHGVNAFFIRKDIFDENRCKFDYPLDDKSLFNPPRFWFLPGYRGHRNSFRFPEMVIE